MRIRTRKNLKRHNLLVILLFFLPFGSFLGYASGVFYILDDLASFTYTIGLNTTDFIEPDFNKMAQWAAKIDDRFEQYHMASNLSLTITFTDYNYTTPVYYHSTDNAGLSTGTSLATYCFKYKAAKDEGNQTMMEDALRIIKGLLTGFSYMLAVPNGGIGPDYPGIPARFYWAPEHKSIPGYEHVTNWMLSPHVRHFNGSGDYKNWRCRLYTSKDEMGGYLFGLGRTLQLCDDPWVQERVKLLIAQLIEGFRKTNWLVIGGDGNPCGTDLKATLGSGEWVLSLLNLGRIAHPGVYDDLWHYYATKNMYMNGIGEGSNFNIIEEYYGWNFGHMDLFNLIMTTQDPNLKQFFINEYIQGTYPLIRYHRNAFFNMIYLVWTGDENQTIRNDIFDQLMRFQDNIEWGKGGYINFNATERPSWHTKNPAPEKWKQILNGPLGFLYAPVALEIDFTDELWMQPATVDMMYYDPGNFWGDNPFEEDGGRQASGLTEGDGRVYNCVYWMGRAYGIIPPPSS